MRTVGKTLFITSRADERTWPKCLCMRHAIRYGACRASEKNRA
jgi:hypothetical protein